MTSLDTAMLLDIRESTNEIIIRKATHAARSSLEQTPENLSENACLATEFLQFLYSFALSKHAFEVS